MTLRLKSYAFYIRLLTYALPSMAFLAAAYVRFVAMGARRPANIDPKFYLMVLAFTTVAWAFISERQRLCDIDELFRENSGFRKAIAACLATGAGVLAVLFFYRQQNFSRIFFIVSSIALLVFTLMSRIVLRWLLRLARGRERLVRVLIVGADEHARNTAARIAGVSLVPAEIVGYLRVDEQEAQVCDKPVFEPADIGSANLPVFDEIVIAATPERFTSIGKVLSKLEVLCVPTRLVLELGGLPIVRERLFQFGDMQMLDLAATPLEAPAYFFLKRAFDVLFALLALTLMAPVIVIVALAIKLTSPGPVLFRQERVGLNGRPFQMYKFRTMRNTALGESDTRWTVRDDPRRTWVGHILRKTSFDELPQFLNVLKGDMSVVGPRPERPHFVKRFLEEISHYDTRHRLKVGITGWAQVNGWRGDTSIQKRFEFDLYYLQNWSFWFDLRIIALTAWSGMFGRNAY